MGGRELASRYLQSLATATQVADLGIVSGIGCPDRRACSCIAVRHSWIVASMVKRQRTFSQLALWH
jgi:hypothetical protein